MRYTTKKTLAFALSLCLVSVFLLPTIAAMQPGCFCVEFTCPICEAVLERYDDLGLQGHRVYIDAACSAVQHNLAEIYVAGFINVNTRMNH